MMYPVYEDEVGALYDVSVLVDGKSTTNNILDLSALTIDEVKFLVQFCLKRNDKFSLIVHKGRERE